MAFWDNFDTLCRKNKTTPNAVARELGFSNATATKWKSGSQPNGATLQKISDYFNVSVDALLGIKNNGNSNKYGELNELEQRIIKAYRAQPDIQALIREMLGVDAKDGSIRVYTAAHSEDNHHDGVVTLQKDEWNRIKNAPDTDQTLI